LFIHGSMTLNKSVSFTESFAYKATHYRGIVSVLTIGGGGGGRHEHILFSLGLLVGL